MRPILGIDPGTRKCGYAVLDSPLSPPLDQGIVDVGQLPACLKRLIETYAVRVVALGGGTHTEEISALISAVGLPFTVVDERETTLKARARYFQAHPPRGWKRLIPRGMLLPPCPIDDFAALLIAERYLACESQDGSA